MAEKKFLILDRVKDSTITMNEIVEFRTHTCSGLS